MNHLALAFAAAVLGALAPAAAANPTDTAAAAEQLFAEGRALIGAGKIAEACPKFEASLRLDPALGTRLNLADCYERAGKWTSAWAAFKAAADAARGARDDRAPIAADRARALEAKLPRLRVVVPSPIAGLAIVRDGASLEPTLIGTAMYVDPGPIHVDARAPGRQERVFEVVAIEGQTVEVSIELTPVRAARVRADPGRGRRRVALVVAAAGGAIVGVGLGFGYAARVAWHDAHASGECVDDPPSCSPAGQALVARAHRRATIANVAVGVGLGAAAAAAVIYFTAPRRFERSVVVPVASADTVGVGWLTTF